MHFFPGVTPFNVHQMEATLILDLIASLPKND